LSAQSLSRSAYANAGPAIASFNSRVATVPFQAQDHIEAIPHHANQASRFTRGSASCAILRHRHKAIGRSGLELLKFLKWSPKLTEKVALTALRPSLSRLKKSIT
jgi:hypothetical protein